MKKFMLFLLAVAAFGAVANAGLVHRYEFNGNANDSIGTAHGTLGAGGTIADGKLITDGTAYGTNISAGVSLPLTAIN